jgi:hypothetical protein
MASAKPSGTFYGSCFNLCGRVSALEGGGQCYCDKACATQGDCCTDHETFCVVVAKSSNAQQKSAAAGAANPKKKKKKKKKKKTAAGKNAPSEVSIAPSAPLMYNAVPPGGPLVIPDANLSCQDRCGQVSFNPVSKQLCYCDSECQWHADCCQDQQEFCPQTNSP